MRVTSCHWGPELQGPPLLHCPRCWDLENAQTTVTVQKSHIASHWTSVNHNAVRTVIPARILPGLQAGAELSCRALVSLLRAAPCRAQERGHLGGRAGTVQCAAAKRKNPTMNHAMSNRSCDTNIQFKIKSHLVLSLYKVCDVMKADRDQTVSSVIPDS